MPNGQKVSKNVHTFVECHSGRKKDFVAFKSNPDSLFQTEWMNNISTLHAKIRMNCSVHSWICVGFVLLLLLVMDHTWYWDFHPLCLHLHPCTPLHWVGSVAQHGSEWNQQRFGIHSIATWVQVGGPCLIQTWTIWIPSQFKVLCKSHVDLSCVNLPV